MAQTVDTVYINGVLVFKRIEVAAADLDSEGVFEFDVDTTSAGSHLFLENGLTLKGIRILSSSSALELEDEQEVLVMISSAGTASIVHDSGDVTEPTQRFRTSDGFNGGVNNRRIQCFWSTAGGFRRWEFPNW